MALDEFYCMSTCVGVCQGKWIVTSHDGGNNENYAYDRLVFLWKDQLSHVAGFHWMQADIMQSMSLISSSQWSYMIES